MPTPTYGIRTFYSQEDEAYIATVPAWGGVSVHGSTRELAEAAAREVLDTVVQTFIEQGRPLPACPVGGQDHYVGKVSGYDDPRLVRLRAQDRARVEAWKKAGVA